MRAAPADIAAEIDRNGAMLTELLGERPANFAYPFGGISQTAKAAAHCHFASCRGTGRGLNRGTVDLADLRSTSLYARDFDRDRLCGLIDEAKAQAAWLIFFTHDVAEQPSDFGCTPKQFDAIVAHAAANTSVLPVRDVLTRLGLMATAEQRAA